MKNKESSDVNNRQLKHRVNLSSFLTLICRNVINYVKDPFCASRLILHTKWGLVVRGHLEPLCMFIVSSKTKFMFFKQHPWLFTGWWRQYLVRHSTGWCLCKHFTFWRMTQNIVKKNIGNVASSYQVNLAIEIPNITENYIKSHVFTCRYWVSAMLIKYTSRCWEVFLNGQIFFLIGRARS